MAEQLGRRTNKLIYHACSLLKPISPPLQMISVKSYCIITKTQKVGMYIHKTKEYFFQKLSAYLGVFKQEITKLKEHLSQKNNSIYRSQACIHCF